MSIEESSILEIIVNKPTLFDKLLALLGGKGLCGYCDKENSFIGFRYSFRPEERIGGTAILNGADHDRLAWCHSCGSVEDLNPAPSED
ncbi:hypothetical protein A2V71_02840 [Candidatus Berkelbacteria bacterium RBG_13_40_8]|uniref:Uncharacterized protein n=1 Tax=Candidatus Berkelbacteria bacterium RBG_13_40_8 TaxID=1797467 RepID=A0A1F5DMA1_9BACT|nr:MAG: hypothetical protein A2V71_02840 [Candidatus Berkelbacteria bacterium RBG_13_40_8]